MIYGFGAKNNLSAIIMLKVVGGIDSKMPSLPLATGVKIISYSKLHSEVSLYP